MVIPAVKDLGETTAWTVDPDFRDFRDPRDPQDKPPQRLTWTRFRELLLRVTKPEVEPPASDFCRRKWDPWDLADPRDLPDLRVR